ncbi:hypothetical protein NEOLEDRAFT_1093001 [Neolentinus lepideus HHB14362 ss-1]|uniref:Aip3p/Bud6 N-terminal domain-containing protein n=1 Tax=Neolentinus lepideus HHB14362 ss-1 TaxID=1314782 RepID=A0A165SH87_9AGAM|nr:hypothetical protein NEOLEDRAFT_1093001 [Neolentinus lepideus HHB14362 ss-1]
MSGSGHQKYAYSSGASSSPGGSSTDSRRQQTTPVVDVPAAVQNLLLATKRLQEILRQWSLMQASETQVSDVYVQLGNEFNIMVTAFARYNIDMSDVYAVPKELRTVLEQCLAEDPSQQVLEQHMPTVRQILYNLLEGLKSKQNDYWRVAGGRRH